MKKKGFLIVKIILIVIISVIIGFGIYTWNAQMMMGSQLPMPLGFGIAEVLSDSMYPTIKTGDVVIIVPQDEYQVGDIVAFQDDNMVVTHRIVGIHENGDFITQGDANNTEDTHNNDLALKEIYIYGKVVKTFEGIGPVVRVIKSPVVSVLLLIVAALLFVLSAKKEKETEDKSLDKIRDEIAALKGDKKIEALSAEDIEAQIAALKKEAEEKSRKNK